MHIPLSSESTNHVPTVHQELFTLLESICRYIFVFGTVISLHADQYTSLQTKHTLTYKIKFCNANVLKNQNEQESPIFNLRTVNGKSTVRRERRGVCFDPQAYLGFPTRQKDDFNGYPYAFWSRNSNMLI